MFIIFIRQNKLRSVQTPVYSLHKVALASIDWAQQLPSAFYQKTSRKHGAFLPTVFAGAPKQSGILIYKNAVDNLIEMGGAGSRSIIMLKEKKVDIYCTLFSVGIQSVLVPSRIFDK